MCIEKAKPETKPKKRIPPEPMTSGSTIVELFFTPIKWLWALEAKWNQEFSGGDPQNVVNDISEIHIYFCHGLLKHTT